MLFSASSFAQTRFVVTYTNATDNGKEVISFIENHIPDTYNRRLEMNALEFSTVVDYEIAYVASILELANVQDAVVRKERAEINTVQKAGGTNCEQAMQLCSSSSVPGNSSGAGVQELPDNNTIDGCLRVEHQSSWYYLNVLTPGNLVLRINPDDNDDDYDFAIWGPFSSTTANANCPPITSPIRCSYSQQKGNTGLAYGASDESESSSGDKWVNPLAVTAGQIYIMLVDNYSTSYEGYNIEFSYTGNLSTAILGCTPVVLPVGISEFEGLKVGDDNVITWTTESELNNDYFTLEWSATGFPNEWQTVQTVNGAGDSETTRNYSAVHSNYRQNSMNYYRLTQTDFNGKETMIEKIVVIDNK